MIEIIISLIILLASPQPATTERSLSPIDEPIPIAVYSVYLPNITNIVSGAQGQARTIYGVGSPHRKSYEYIPHYNWTATEWQCEASATYIPMITKNSTQSFPEVCNDGRMVLIENEPELARISPYSIALLVNKVSLVWKGDIACCNVYYGDIHGVMSGILWMETFYDVYAKSFGEDAPVDAISIHIYESPSLTIDLLKNWRKLADERGVKLIVTEAGTFPVKNADPERVAARLPAFLDIVQKTIQPDMLLWFSDYIKPWVLGDGTAWHHLNLFNEDGTLTVVGEAYEQYTNLFWR